MQTALPAIVIISHINPLLGESGQHQRVLNTLKALTRYFNVDFLFGSVSHRESSRFKEGMNSRFGGVKSLAITKSASPVFRFRSKLYEYIPGYKPSNFQIPYIFDLASAEAHIDFSTKQVVLFEYWHAYTLALALKKKYPHLNILCDTHNILSATFPDYVRQSHLKSLFKNYLIRRYQRLEFEKALPSFDSLIGINLEEFQEYQRRFPNRQHWYMPMGIELQVFQRLTDAIPAHRPFTILYYGGLGSDRNRRDVCWLYEQLVKPLASEGLSIKIRIVGSRAPEGFSDYFDASLAEYIGFASDLRTAFSGVHLAVIPWQGKFGFRSRIIEIMALGIPVLTSTDAVWGMGFSHGENIFTPADFYNDAMAEVRKLYDRPDILETIADAAWQYVHAHFSFENTYQRWAETLAAVCRQKSSS